MRGFYKQLLLHRIRPKSLLDSSLRSSSKPFNKARDYAAIISKQSSIANAQVATRSPKYHESPHPHQSNFYQELQHHPPSSCMYYQSSVFSIFSSLPSSHSSLRYSLEKKLDFQSVEVKDNTNYSRRSLFKNLQFKINM